MGNTETERLRSEMRGECRRGKTERDKKDTE